jgi:glucosyl-dolichyl phosphate glucuronosyltransferase
MTEHITLAICTYNNSSLLDRTLAAIERQSVSEKINWSAIVVDNNSTDNTQQIVLNYIEKGKIPKLHYVFETQQGLAHARRRAIAETQSESIAFIDDDCLLSSHWLEQAVAFLQEHPHAGAIGGKVELLWEVEPQEIYIQYQKSFSAQDWGELPLKLPSKGWTYLVGAGLLLRRKALEESGWLESGNLVDRCETKLSSGGDIEMVLRIRRAGYELWYNPAMQLQHYIPQKRMSAEYLYRLHRSFGESTNLLILLADDEVPTLAWRLGRIYASFKNLSRQILGLLFKELILFRQASQTRIILVQRAIGDLEAAYKFFWTDYRL